MTRLGVILGTVRSNRVGASVAQWVVDKANTVEGVNADVIDIASFNMSLFAEPMPPAMATPQDPGGAKFNETVSSYDALIFVSPEYNHSIPGALKNAIDFLEPKALANKGVGFVGYSFSGGVRQVEHLRQILANFEAAMVTQQVSLSLITDFENKSEFKPDAHHDNEVQGMVAAMVARTDALAPLR